MHINRLVEQFLNDAQLAPTTFGRLAAGDPRIVLDMRNGRSIGERVANRLRHFIATYHSARAIAEGDGE